MVKNKSLKKSEIRVLKKKQHSFLYKWVKIYHLLGKKEGLFVVWSLPKKNIPRAVDRNRLRRWGREFLKEHCGKGQFLILFLPKEKGFYKALKRKDFDHVFKNTMEKINTES